LHCRLLLMSQHRLCCVCCCVSCRAARHVRHNTSRLVPCQNAWTR